MLLSLSRFCSNQASPHPCAEIEVTTSFNPSPLTSKTPISAPPVPKFSGWKVHVSCLTPLGGCSHHPLGATTSIRPSPLISPTPMPWPLAPPGLEILVMSQGAVGLAVSGLA